MIAQTRSAGSGAQTLKSLLAASSGLLLVSFFLPLTRGSAFGLQGADWTLFAALGSTNVIEEPQILALWLAAVSSVFGVVAGIFWDRIAPVLRLACFVPMLFALYMLIRFAMFAGDIPAGSPSLFSLVAFGPYLFFLASLAVAGLAATLIYQSDDKLIGFPVGDALEALEIDPRLLGMLMAFAAVAVVFTIWTEGTFVGPRNIFNISVQTVPVAIMACGMVFVIVARHIDLSVGSMLAMCSAIMAMSQTYWIPSVIGLEYGNPVVLGLTMFVGLASGTLMGAITGWLVGYQRIPSFIVTLGGLFVWRNVNWFTTNGQSVSLTDPNLLMFGGTEGVLGAAASWILGLIASAIAVWAIFASRRNKQSHGFMVKPLWAEGVMAGLIVGVILFFVGWLSRYPIPEAKLKRLFEARGEVMPEGYTAMHGLPISVLILIVVGVGMTVVARKTTFGRYIFAAGGNPDAAELSGINTRALTVKIFALMGFLCALAALIAQARLQSHGNDIGMLEELRVIAAAVIGGTALAGGVGTIYGAILGALIMQSLQSGMAMVGVDTPFQNIIVGLVLIIAVWVDILYRKRLGLSK